MAMDYLKLKSRNGIVQIQGILASLEMAKNALAATREQTREFTQSGKGQIRQHKAEIAKSVKLFIRFWCILDFIYTSWFWWFEPRTRGIKPTPREYIQNVSILAAEATIATRL
jgi:hypothetical protein